MKWYFAINDAGSEGHVGRHAKLAVTSARRNTDLDANLLYTGKRNDFTRWMEQQGVRVIDCDGPFREHILDLEARGKYSSSLLGHWLRASVCQIERSEPYVLYTDCDVVFLSQPDLGGIEPPLFACAPEFKPDNWNYFNSGVMVMNLPGLRAEYDEFIAFSKNLIEEKGSSNNDQHAYNLFYRGRWDRLDIGLNWKPYWGSGEGASIMHFHGPKLNEICAIIDGRWNWTSNYGRQIGSMFAANLEGYRIALQSTLRAVGDTPSGERAEVERALAGTPGFTSPGELNLRFMNFRLFGD